MSERNYYVLCDDNCRFPALTAEQVIEAIAEATGNVPTHVDEAFITKLKSSGTGQNVTVWVGTQAQYNALSPAPGANEITLRFGSDGKLYIISDQEVPGYLAEILEDIEELQEAVSGYSSAISELQSDVGELETDVGGLQTTVGQLNTTVGQLQTAVSGKAETVTYTVTLNTTWTGSTAPYTKEVTVNGIKATDNPVVDIVLSGTAATDTARLTAWGYVGRIVTAANKITVTCYENKPTVSLPIQLKVVR